MPLVRPIDGHAVYLGGRALLRMSRPPDVAARASSLRGYRIARQPAQLRHFTAVSEPLG